MAGGFYAKGKFVEGLFFGWIAPIALVPLWYVVVFAVSMPLRLVYAGWPVLASKVEHPEGWAWWGVAFLLNPYLLALLITAGLFVFYCHYERMHRDLPVGPDVAGGRAPSTSVSRAPAQLAPPPVLKRVGRR